MQARWITLFVGSALLGGTLGAAGCKSGAPATTGDNGAVPVPGARSGSGDGTSCDTPNEGFESNA